MRGWPFDVDRPSFLRRLEAELEVAKLLKHGLAVVAISGASFEAVSKAFPKDVVAQWTDEHHVVLITRSTRQDAEQAATRGASFENRRVAVASPELATPELLIEALTIPTGIQSPQIITGERYDELDEILAEADVTEATRRGDQLHELFLEARARELLAWPREGVEGYHMALDEPVPTCGELFRPKLTGQAQQRLDALLFFEDAAARGSVELDLAMLVMAGCQIIEEQLRAILVPAAQASIDELLGAFEDDRRPREILEGWSSGRIPVTLGVLQLILAAGRRSLEQARPRTKDIMATTFAAPFHSLLLGRALEKALGAIRDEFRNPVAHGTRLVTRADYERFAGLSLAATTFRYWYESGPASLSFDGALLHHHLANWLGPFAQ